MEEQNSLFGVKLPESVLTLKEEIVNKEKNTLQKHTRRKGTISIHLNDNLEMPLAVDFEGHNEGSGTPCKDEAEVMKEVSYLKAKHEKEYKLEVIDEREKEQKARDLIKGKKIIVKVKYGLDSDDKRDFFVSDNRREVGIESYLGGTHISAYGGRIGEKEKTFEEKEKEAIDWVIKDVMQNGIKREDIEIIKEEMSEEDLKKHNLWKAERRKNELVNADREIKNLSSQLKKWLEIKYGFKVKIEVLKDV